VTKYEITPKNQLPKTNNTQNFWFEGHKQGDDVLQQQTLLERAKVFKARPHT
jgi:hypothetical protein